MPFRIIKRMVKYDKCVYWDPSGELDTYGQHLFLEPVELDCRWEDEELVIVDSQGREVKSVAQVNVLEDLKVEGVLWHGYLCDLADPYGVDPFVNEKAWSIKRFDKLPTLKYREYLRTAYLGPR